MNKLTLTNTIFIIHLILLGLFIGLAFWDASQKINQFNRSHILTWPAAFMIAWMIYFYLFYVLYLVIGSTSANKYSAYSVIISGLILTLVQIFSGIPALAFAIMPTDFILKPIVKTMKTHASGSTYKSEKPYVLINNNEKAVFNYKNTQYQLNSDGPNVELCKETQNSKVPTCITLPRIKMFAAIKAAQFFPKDQLLYICLPNVGIWKINTNNFEHDLSFFENIRNTQTYIDDKDYTGDIHFYLMQVKDDQLILRHGLWVYSTDLDGKNPAPLAVDRMNGLEIDN